MKPQIIRQVYDKDKLIIFEATKLVTPTGSGGHIVLPKKLVGKIVKVIYEHENNT